jgi:proteasome assembly chaperone 2
LEKIGDFDPKYFVPVVGAREDGHNGITTPFERKHSRHASV